MTNLPIENSTIIPSYFSTCADVTTERDRQLFLAILAAIDKTPLNIRPYSDLFALIRNMSEYALSVQYPAVRTVSDGAGRRSRNTPVYGWKLTCLSAVLKGKLRDGNKTARSVGDTTFPTKAYELNRKVLCWEGTDLLDSFILYMEANRLYDKQFYLPRRPQLYKVVKAMQRMANKEIELLAVSCPPGVGKLLANGTPVLTRNGWKCHGDLVVGDEVIGLDGKYKKVIAVHPKNYADRLVTFTNGDKIQCHENHQWLVYNKSKEKLEVLETKDLERSVLERGTPNRRGHRYMFLLPHRKSVVGEEKDLPLDPYTFGVWLGDGKNTAPTICGHKKDYAVIQRIEEHGWPVRWKTENNVTHVMYYGFGFRQELKRMGMGYCRTTTTKHIPAYYLTASLEQRLMLLAGLIDTDGCRKGNQFVYTTTEMVLARNVLDLIATFGWRTSTRVEQPKVSTSGVHGRKPYYCISFTPDLQIPCALKRKQNNTPPKQRRIAIRSIKRVKPKEGNCITVDGDGIYLAGRSMLPTHNSTLAMFFLCWLSGRDPEKPMLTGSHNKDFLSGVYGECLRMLDPQGEYLFYDIFPDLKVVYTNAKTLMIDLGEKDKRSGKRFATLEYTSIGAGNAGKVRAENLLYCDDLVDGLETALSRDRLDKLWGLYTTDLRQRKIGECPELHIATRWSVHDVIGRLEAMYSDSDKAEFIVLPALNDNDESNFDYPIAAGFSTEFYHQQRSVMDEASWLALYMNQPIEREGQLYPEEKLRRYFDLPDREPDAIIAVCDTKDRGSDYCSMPIAYVYGQDYYIADVVCDNSAPDIVDMRLVQKLMSNKVEMARFESNSAGGRVAEKVQNIIKEKGGKTRITTKWTSQNKETKIIVSAPWIMERCLFKDSSVIKDNKEYRTFMRLLTTYTLVGKNKHDDVPDSMAQLYDYSESFTMSKVSVFDSPWKK